MNNPQKREGPAALVVIWFLCMAATWIFAGMVVQRAEWMKACERDGFFWHGDTKYECKRVTKP